MLCKSQQKLGWWDPTNKRGYRRWELLKQTKKTIPQRGAGLMELYKYINLKMHATNHPGKYLWVASKVL